MSFNFSLTSFFILIIAYLVIVEIFTVLFRLTGLREDKARFQAISLMTNSGYTSKESELIMNSSIRKNLATMMMLFGYIFAVSGVSLLVNLFIRAGKAQFNWLTLLYSLLFLLIIIAITRSKWLIRHFDRLVEYLAQRKDDGLFCNNIRILEMIHDKLIAEIMITRLPSEIAGKNLEETNFSSTYMLNVLLIKRGSQIIDHVTPRDELKKGDRVLIYGSKNILLSFLKKMHLKIRTSLKQKPVKKLLKYFH